MPPSGEAHPPTPTLEVQALINRRGPPGMTAFDPIWLAGFRINGRKVSSYRWGRAFLCGDAAHVHSPAGGQGMNTGICIGSSATPMAASPISGRKPSCRRTSLPASTRKPGPEVDLAHKPATGKSAQFCPGLGRQGLAVRGLQSKTGVVYIPSNAAPPLLCLEIQIFLA
jgi:FAD binding domain